MCVVVFKPKGQELPNIERLYDCFAANPDGAGYMFQEKYNVHIKKGFMTFSDFYASLKTDYEENNGKDVDFVLHFRISTQGGVNKQCCHPYVISKKMDDLYALDVLSNMGVAHNGIITLTSESEYGYGYGGKYGNYGYEPKKYNDTMKFITDYLSLFVKDGLDLYDDDKMELVEKLIGSGNKLAIMSPYETKLIGSFTELDGLYYSNTYFLYNHREITTKQPKNTVKEGEIDCSNISNIEDYLVEKDDDCYEYDCCGQIDGAAYGSCGMAMTCRKCKWFSGCYGFDFPEEWEDWDDDELQEVLDAYYGGYSDEYIQKKVEESKEQIRKEQASKKKTKKGGKKK